MGKHDLPARTPTRQPDASPARQPHRNQITSSNGDTWDLSQKDISTILEAGAAVVHGIVSIQQMKAETDSYVRRTEADTRQYTELMDGQMRKDRQDADIWREQFDRRMEAIMQIMDRNPGRSLADLSVLLDFLNKTNAP